MKKQMFGNGCWCEACDINNHAFRTKMPVCPQCGSKRCERAKWHGNECSTVANPLIGNSQKNTMAQIPLRFTRTNPAAIAPTYATDGSGCFDLYAPANQRAYDFLTVDIGLAFEVPAGYMMRIESRSGLAAREHIKAFPGIVDSDYRGSVRVLLYQFAPSDQPISVKAGDRIAQAWVTPCERVSFVQVDELSETGRGAGGFGSTGR